MQRAITGDLPAAAGSDPDRSRTAGAAPAALQPRTAAGSSDPDAVRVLAGGHGALQLSGRADQLPAQARLGRTWNTRPHTRSVIRRYIHSVQGTHSSYGVLALRASGLVMRGKPRQ